MEYILLLGVLLWAFYTDLRSCRIPNKLCGIGILSGLSLHILMDQLSGLRYSLLGLLAGFCCLTLLYLFKGVGAGDVKLFAAIGALSGVEFTLYCAMYSILYAGLAGIIILLFRRQFMRRILHFLQRLPWLLVLPHSRMLVPPGEELLRFPFMIAVLPAAVTTMFYFWR